MNKVQTKKHCKNGEASMNGDVDVIEKATPNYGPWMQVNSAKGKKTRNYLKKHVDTSKKNNKIGAKNKEASAVGSRFNALYGEAEPLDH